MPTRRDWWVGPYKVLPDLVEQACVTRGLLGDVFVGVWTKEGEHTYQSQPRAPGRVATQQAQQVACS